MYVQWNRNTMMEYALEIPIHEYENTISRNEKLVFLYLILNFALRKLAIIVRNYS